MLASAQSALTGAGPGWAAVLVGDPGIGKSRILAELNVRLARGRHATGYGRCREHGNLVSYATWRECLGQLGQIVAKTHDARGDAARAAIYDLLGDPAVADLCVLVPVLAAIRPAAATAAAAPPVGNDAGVRRVSQAVVRLVSTICAHIPTALILEDLHWADQGTLDILGALVSAPLPPGVLILCTTRPEGALPPGPALTRVELGPLDETTSADLLRALAGDMRPEVIAELTAAIPLLRMGNPLVDTQVILHLKREGLLATAGDGRVVLSDRFGRDYEPPTSVSSVLERRLEHVPERVRDILGIASLLGRQFRRSALREVAAPDIRAHEVDAAVREAVDLALCRADQDECVFVHDVIRDHLETTVPIERRPALHARIAHTLREHGAPAATLAYHLDQAGDVGAAAAKYFDGGIEADRVHDLVGSSRNLRRALALYLKRPASPQRDRDLARTASELVRITCLLGKTHEPLEDLDRCRRAMIAPSAATMVMLDSAYARVYYAQGQFDRAMDHSERSLAVDDPELGPYQCVPANMLGRALCASGHFGPSIEVLLRGCALLRDAGDLVELAHSEGLLATSLAFVGDYSRSLQHIAESRRLAEVLDDPARRMGVCLYTTLHHEAAFQWDQGLQASAELLTHAEEYSMAGLYLYLGTMMAGRHHFHVGELRRARHLLRNAINFSDIFGILTCKSWALAYLGDVYFVEGRLDDARGWYTKALDLAREGRGDGLGVPLALIGQAHVAASRGAPLAEVRALAEEAFESFEAASNTTSLATALVRYREAVAACGGDPAIEAAIAARLDELLARLGVGRCEFWPAVPAGATAEERAMSTPDYWRRRAKSDRAAAEKQSKSRTETGSLLFNLSTVEGFIPSFAGRPPILISRAVRSRGGTRRSQTTPSQLSTTSA